MWSWRHETYRDKRRFLQHVPLRRRHLVHRVDVLNRSFQRFFPQLHTVHSTWTRMIDQSASVASVRCPVRPATVLPHRLDLGDFDEFLVHVGLRTHRFLVRSNSNSSAHAAEHETPFETYHPVSSAPSGIVAGCRSVPGCASRLLRSIPSAVQFNSHKRHKCESQLLPIRSDPPTHLHSPPQCTQRRGGESYRASP